MSLNDFSHNLILEYLFPVSKFAFLYQITKWKYKNELFKNINIDNSNLLKSEKQSKVYSSSCDTEKNK